MYILILVILICLLITFDSGIKYIKVFKIREPIQYIMGLLYFHSLVILMIMASIETLYYNPILSLIMLGLIGIYFISILILPFIIKVTLFNKEEGKLL